MEGKKKKKKIDIHLPPTCFSRRKTAFWQIYKMQLFLTIYTFIFQSGIKVLIAVAEKHNPPPLGVEAGWCCRETASVFTSRPVNWQKQGHGWAPPSVLMIFIYCAAGGGGGEGHGRLGSCRQNKTICEKQVCQQAPRSYNLKCTLFSFWKYTDMMELSAQPMRYNQQWNQR